MNLNQTERTTPPADEHQAHGLPAYKSVGGVVFEGQPEMVFRDSTTTQLRAARRPFQIFAIELWGYLRLHEGSLDSERMCRNIELRCENELCFVVEPLKAEIARLQKLLDSKFDALAKTRAERRDLQKLLDAVRKQGEALQQEATP